MSRVPQIRLLPSLIVCAVALLGLKLVGLGVGLEAVLSGVQPAYAEETASGTLEDAGGGEPGEPELASGEDEAMPADVALTPEDFDLPSGAEREVLSSLADRRKELDARERELQLEARLLEASERRVQARIAELKEIEARIEELFGVQEEEQQQQLASLVTMYETMKPKDAARILGQLDMDVLIQVVKGMSERKMAPILAAMDPVTAQELTIELATGNPMAGGMDMSAVLEEAPALP
ncbi:MAG: hypothetical protein RLO08_18615 [Parvibaculaceae bacterium]